jgi:protein SCO1/2
MSKAWALLVIPASLLIAIAAKSPTGDGFRAGVFEPPRAAPGFELRGSNGSALTLNAYRGKVVALAFGFSHCTSICPVTLAKLAEVSQRLGRSAKDLQVLFVTVDPERDDPARLREFLDFFNPAFVGATGNETELEALHQAYGVTATRVASHDQMDYQVHHSSSIYLIDREGKLRLLVPFGKSADDILHDVSLLLEQ